MNYIKYIHSVDGTTLYVKVNENVNSSANIIICHGLAEHLDRYDEISNYLQEKNFNIIRFDQRGHGRSGGKRTFYSNVNEIVEDLEAVINFTKEHYKGNIYLIGHSMGGYGSVLYSTKNPGKINGLIISGAVTRYNQKTFGDIDDTIDRNKYINYEIGEGVCSDTFELEKYRLDALTEKKVSYGLIYTVLEGVKGLVENAQYFDDNILILHGKDDGLVHYSDSLDFYKNISSSKKELHIYDGLQHEIFNERKKNKEIFSEIANWINNDLT
ncbi:TPA: lysophospholipase [Staphylococcus aureus]|nr:lysophospholipase [Staphylococcus aureus]HDH6010804.1 lysophospholipase [Staphylococcus aureus]HDH6089889.1 lysophospholipase [Staphylococcus aureus]